MAPSTSDELICCNGHGVCRWIYGGRTLRVWPEPIEALQWLDRRRRATPGHRWVGYFAYELSAFLDGIEPRVADGRGLPLFVFSRHAERPPGASLRKRNRTTAGSASPDLLGIDAAGGSWQSAYESGVCRIIEYIRAGDVFQANLAHFFTRQIHEPCGTIYRRLCGAAGDWYSALLDYGRFAIVANSPELFLRVSADGRVVNRPIKGTRPRGPGMREQLMRSEKDAAELNMIVDVQRNDLGRVCEIGSVKVSQPRAVEAHPTVLHGVATVEGKLRAGVGLVELLRATFPCGSVTGAPKIRAMQIISELERRQRGVYCGAVGYLGADGGIMLNVAIRTMTLLDGIAEVPVGAGIVADSQPEAEARETVIKAQAMLDALVGGRREKRRGVGHPGPVRPSLIHQ
jgi:para-aminobenzoate synthetase component 1